MKKQGLLDIVQLTWINWSAGLLLTSLSAVNSEQALCQYLGLGGGPAALPSPQPCSLQRGWYGSCHWRWSFPREVLQQAELKPLLVLWGYGNEGKLKKLSAIIQFTMPFLYSSISLYESYCDWLKFSLSGKLLENFLSTYYSQCSKDQKIWLALSNVLPVREMAGHNNLNTPFGAHSVLLLAVAAPTGVGQACRLQSWYISAQTCPHTEQAPAARPGRPVPQGEGTGFSMVWWLSIQLNWGHFPCHRFGWLSQVGSPQIPEYDSWASRDCYAWSPWGRVFSLIKARSSLSFAFRATDESWALFFTNRIQDLQDGFKAAFRHLWSLLSPCSCVTAITSSNLLIKPVL